MIPAPASGKMRQENCHKLKANLGEGVSSRPGLQSSRCPNTHRESITFLLSPLPHGAKKDEELGAAKSILLVELHLAVHLPSGLLYNTCPDLFLLLRPLMSHMTCYFVFLLGHSPFLLGYTLVWPSNPTSLLLSSGRHSPSFCQRKGLFPLCSQRRRPAPQRGQSQSCLSSVPAFCLAVLLLGFRGGGRVWL